MDATKVDGRDHQRHNEGLDVLRAVCALSVFLFHCHLLDLGWMGVQVFFVISGFLITASIETRPGATARGRVFAFYKRRIKRILPPLYIYLLFALPYVLLFRKDLVGGWLAALTFTYNLYNLTSAFVNTSVLSHLWSLGIEEQFYLLFPLLLVFFRRHTTTVLLLVCLIMPAFRLGFTDLAGRAQGFVRSYFPMQPGTFATYVAGFTQLDAFAFGALLQLHFQRLQMLGTTTAVLATLLAMIVLLLVTAGSDDAPFVIFFGAPGAYQYVWGYTLIALLGGLLTIRFSAMQANTVLRRALSALGRYSYEFYIVHFALLGIGFSFIDPGPLVSRIAVGVICLPIATGLAVLLHWASEHLAAVVTFRRPSVAH
jgi:peptidoglycan/LPS O-acetylase OafA/YrhL